MNSLVINKIHGGKADLGADTFIYTVAAWELALGLFVSMTLCIIIGRRVGLWRIKKYGESDNPVSSTTVSALFGLLAFLLAFTFGMSSSRFDTRRKNVVDEANALGTAILRADMYFEPHRTAFRKDFQNYLEARILYYQAKTNLDHVGAARMRADAYGQKLWKRATDLSKDVQYESATRQMIPALNESFDLATSRLSGELARVPTSIVLMLFVLAITAAFYVGYMSAAKGRLDWVPAIGFTFLISVVIYITLDLDRPRRGFIQLDTSERAMLELRDLFEKNN